MSTIVRNTSNRWLAVMTTSISGASVPRHIEPHGELRVSQEDAERIKANYGSSIEIQNVPVAMMPPTGRL